MVSVPTTATRQCQTAVTRSGTVINTKQANVCIWLYRILYSWQDVMPRTKHERINRVTTCITANITTISNNTLFSRGLPGRDTLWPVLVTPNINFFSYESALNVQVSSHTPLNYSSDVILCMFFFLIFFKALLYTKTLGTDTRAMPINRLQMGHHSRWQHVFFSKQIHNRFVAFISFVGNVSLSYP